MQSAPRKHPVLRFLFRWTYRFVAAVVLVAFVGYLYLFRGALYNYFVTFPKQAASWEALRAQRSPVAVDDGYSEFRGVLHTHSERSHDSQVTYPEILEAAKVADVDFLFVSDHCVDKQASFAEGWQGLHEGILFFRGYEMGNGFMPWGLPENVVLDCSMGPVQLAAEINRNGGMLFFAHSEEERMWDLEELNGMEIYNIHTDLKDEGDGALERLLPDVITSIRRYPDQVIRTLFDRQDAILANWDELNKTRKIVGISANDAHQNNGIQLVYTKDGNLIVQEASGKGGSEYTLNAFTRFLLRLFPGKLEPGKRVYYFAMDPYERSVRFVNTHLLAKEFTEQGLLDALRTGRAFIAFDMIADARTFVFMAEAGGQRAVMGETIALSPDLKIVAHSPVPCRFTLKCDGAVAAQSEGTSFAYMPATPGKYRVEAEVMLVGEWTPWVYTNPLEVTGFTVAAAGESH